MMVEAVRARRRKKTGRVAITFEVDLATWGNMRHKALEMSFFGRLDFIGGVLNMAFLDCFDIEPTPRERAWLEGDDDEIPF